MEPLVRKTVRLVLLCLVAPVILAACSTTYDCHGVQSYMYAEQFPPLKSPPGLDVPRPDPSMDIPDVQDGPIGSYENPPRGTKGDDFAYCLVSPPLMPKSGV